MRPIGTADAWGYLGGQRIFFGGVFGTAKHEVIVVVGFAGEIAVARLGTAFVFRGGLEMSDTRSGVPSPYSTSLSQDWFHFYFFGRLNFATLAIVIGRTSASFGRSVRFLAKLSSRSTPKPVRGQSAKPVALQQFFVWPVLGLIAQSGTCA